MIYYLIFGLIIGIAYLLGYRNLWTVFKREVSYYFISPIIYLVGGALLFFAGIFFTSSLSYFNQGYVEPSMLGTLWPTAFLMMFIAPALTMRLVAGETRQGTLELLLTAPVRDWEVILGKFLASWLIVSLLLDLTLPFAFLLAWRGNPDQGLIISAYIGLWLLSGAMIAIGVLASSLTQHQILAFIIALAVILFLWLADIANSFVSSDFVIEALNHLTITQHYHRWMLQRGIINATDVAYFLGLIIGALFLATQVLGTRRWRA